MNLLRNYLQWYQGPVWAVYAARNQQNLSIPYTEPHPPTVSEGSGKAEDTRSSGDGQAPKTLILIALAFLLTGATPPASHVLVTPGKVAMEWFFSDTSGTWDKDVKPETRVWLEIRNFNAQDFQQQGWHPSYTEIIVKPEYRPKLYRLKDGRWGISFTSEVARDLP